MTSEQTESRLYEHNSNVPIMDQSTQRGTIRQSHNMFQHLHSIYFPVFNNRTTQNALYMETTWKMNCTLVVLSLKETMALIMLTIFAQDWFCFSQLSPICSGMRGEGWVGIVPANHSHAVTFMYNYLAQSLHVQPPAVSNLNLKKRHLKLLSDRVCCCNIKFLTSYWIGLVW